MIQPLLLTGPTASGKSAVGLLLAEGLGGEIISVDSMQVYRGLDIGTAKPTREELGRVPHHLIDVVDLTESFDAAQFVRLAKAAMEDIQSRGRVPILCGGTGLYFNALLGGLGEAPPADPVVRAEVEALPTEALLDELATRDPVLFDEIDVNNRRRLVRAVEVIRITGRPFSVQRAAWPDRAPGLAGRSFGLERLADDQRRRIHERVEVMMNSGWIEETQRALAAGLASNRTAAQAIGYRYIAEFLQGERTRLMTVDLIQTKTRQFAKRQRTWLHNQLDLEWLEVAPDEAPANTAERILSKLTTESPAGPTAEKQKPGGS
jgi:tRNA dimethylallyltransferase